MRHRRSIRLKRPIVRLARILAARRDTGPDQRDGTEPTTQPQRVTEEQIAAAQLRILLDQKLGRATPDLVHKIANSLPGARHDTRLDEHAADTAAALSQLRRF